MTLKMDSRVVAPLVSPQVSSTNGFRGPGAGLLSPSRKSGYHIRLHRICRTATPESILSEFFFAALSGGRAARGRAVVAEPLGSDLPVVEREDAVGEDLVGLLPLAGDQDRVTAAGVGQGRRDCAVAVGLDPHPSRAPEAGEQVVEDLIRVFGPGV